MSAEYEKNIISGKSWFFCPHYPNGHNEPCTECEKAINEDCFTVVSIGKDIHIANLENAKVAVNTIDVAE